MLKIAYKLIIGTMSFKPTKLKATRVQANKFSTEFIKYNYLQILKEKKLEEKVEK